MGQAEFDPVQTEVWRHLFASIAEEMGATLERTGFSPNIKERLDHSCALFDADGRLLAQAAHIPVHLGAMPLMMERLRDAVAWPRGVMWLCNDPAHGGTHLPDLTLVAPVYAENTLLGFAANRAHHADVGGTSPGSLPLSTELYHEGIIIPPIRLMRGGKIDSDVAALVCANSRTLAERRGDLAAQVSANETGIRRLQELASRYGRAELRHRAEDSIRCVAALTRRALEGGIPGESTATEYMESDGAGANNLPVTVTTRLEGGRIRFDFTGTAPQTRGSINATEAVTRSACYYVVRCLTDEETPMNAGLFAPVEVIAPPGTLVNAVPPAAVAAGNVETSQRIVDALLASLRPLFPERIPAASQGTMNNLTIGGWDQIRGQSFAYYETICGGGGAGPQSPGASAIHSHMTNTRNTPVEALEMHYPLRVREYRIREGSGGMGRDRGGDGVVRSVELLAEAHVSIISERREVAPGAEGEGEAPAMLGRNAATFPGGITTALPAKTSAIYPPGTVITIETPGGAAFEVDGR